MKEILQNQNYDWCEAVDGSLLSKQDLQKNATALGRYFMTDGMIGCFLSHRKCWQTCVELNEPLLVLEDDVVLKDNFWEIASKVIYDLDKKQEWDILLLGALGCVHPQLKFGLNIIASLVGGKWRRPRRILDLDLENDDDSFIHVPLCPYGCHAYVLHPRGAKRLLESCPKASFHVDVVALGKKQLEIVAIHPLIAWQTNEDTTIGGFVHVWRRYLPTLIADDYTGFEIGWALSAPLLRIGGPYLPRLVLTNGSSFLIMFIGFLTGVGLHSPFLLKLTLVYVLTVTALVRLLSS
ncbi:hypothetical protein CTEN210_02698 [Chaetoceros tenuissimus]|uniref:Glycosyl transferase family 25 domain-containing protein n=1 Tax=Chaetoceros tenuissimus TaxID=426638 RepID=A0AAD3CIE7_9STRA|nr:hypothetical protein CTEN210_02698 [Chaetoceros tenuissimus]